MKKKSVNNISAEVLAAFLDGNATAQESRDILDALAGDAELRELLHISQSVDAELGLKPDECDFLPMTAMAATCNEENYCCLECEKYILRKLHIEFNEEELLQNAVDAFSDTAGDALEVLITVEGDKFMFMHNGKKFSEKDVEGISDVGNGDKANDSKKIGYKGIGFKSVFLPSVENVTILSGDFCFEFDKKKACSLMRRVLWKEKPLEEDEVPWQVIPIEVPEMANFNTQGFSVVTIVRTSEAQKIA